MHFPLEVRKSLNTSLERDICLVNQDFRTFDSLLSRRGFCDRNHIQQYTSAYEKNECKYENENCKF